MMIKQNSLHHVIQDLISILMPAAQSPSEAQVEAWLLLQHVTMMSKATLLAQSVLCLSADQQTQLQELCRQRVEEHKPIQYLLRSVPFVDLMIAVRPPTLIPRPETEEWVVWLIDELHAVRDQPLQILDLCTGTGCIALALAKAFPKATVLGVDIVQSAVDLAQENAKLNGIENVSFVCADLWAGVPDGEVFDLVVSNPPYITEAEFTTLAPEVALWEDKRALVAADMGLAVYKRIAEGLLSRLHQRGPVSNNCLPVVVVELGTDAASVSSMFSVEGLSEVSLHRDLQGVNRWLSGRI